MAATPASPARRLAQRVYVDVPPAPYTTAPYQKIAAMPQLINLTLKENLLQPLNGGAPRPSDLPVVKRKISENELLFTKAANAKKKKIAGESVTRATRLPVNTAANAYPEFPDGFIYCHRCSRKRDVTASIHCTSVKTVKGIKKVCNIKICDRCLKKQYGEDPEKIKAVGIDGVYAFICPRCRDICTCWKCEKLKGSSTAGKSSTMEQSFFALSPSKMTNRVEVLITTTPSKGLYSTVSDPNVKATTTNLELTTVNTSTKTKSGPKYKQQTLQQMLSKPMPELKWTEISTNLSLDDAKSRLEIREFILRFASVMEPSIPRTQLAELDDLGCDSDDNEMAPWVSDACVKSMILGLLGMLATLKGDIGKHIKSIVHDIRAAGSNLNKIWLVLARLQSTTNDSTQLSLPNPLPLPASIVVYNTRTTRKTSETNGGPNVSIGHTAQMIPVLEALIEAALMTPIVREELDNGLKEAKEVTHEVQKAIREENDRWDAERKSFEPPKAISEGELKSIAKAQGEIKIKRELHKMRIRDLENALRLVAPVFAPRFAPLGIDQAGRVYWASSPGVLERKAALDFITRATVSKKGKTNVVDDSALRNWSWFVAVWGRKTHTVGIDPEAGEYDNERWWAFTDPLEIRKVADCIRINAAIDPNSDADASKPLASLVKGLNEYARLLDWRLKEDKYGSVVV